MIPSTYNSYYKLSDGNYVLVNSLSGAVDTIGPEVKSFLGRLKRGDIPSGIHVEELIQFLTHRGYIFKSREEEWKKLLQIKEQVNKISAMSNTGFVFNVCTTYMCNLRCPYCYQGHEIHKQSHALSHEEINKLFEAVDSILSMEKRRGRFVNASHQMMLYGGEPLLPTTKAAVYEVVRRGIEDYGFRFHAITNGTFLHEYIDFFKQYRDMWDYFQITIDGPKHLHDQMRINANGRGTFDRIVHNIDLAMANGFRIGLRTNVNKDNVDQLEELALFIEDKGWPEHPLFLWQISPVTDHYGDNLPNHLPEHKLLAALYGKFGNVDVFLDKFHAQLGTDLNMRTSRIRQALQSKGWSSNPCDSCNSTPNTLPIFKECSARDHRYYAFGAEGLIYACPESVGRKELAVGTFIPSYNIDKKKHDMWNQDITDSEQCSSCSIALFCGGGCGYTNLMRNGDINKPYCNFTHPTISTYIKQNEESFTGVLNN
ncbi:radical SAM/SPASM domain-containing protein [Paenibacillus sp. YYML68]|uniref:radical SAM/SPASM domain-containing protein n=1 Tax=Paenibacillus sp. YYML68 TaxID=2909250 RepID=UPI0024936C7F|nr:radical SAM protein [Paenibacillus sp. YYML68]